MLKIGEFSALTGISIYMLRNYDKIGLLRPEHVDEWSGYRYYNERQILEAGRIQVLKNLGFGLKDISSLKEETVTGASMEAVLKNEIVKKKEEIEVAQNQLVRMERALRDLYLQEQCALSVFVKKFPARNVICLREWIEDFSQEGLLWEQLEVICVKRGIVLSDVRYSFAITHRIDSKEGKIDTEVQRVVDRVTQDMEPVIFRTIPEMEVASVAYQGGYSRIGDINQYISRWIHESEYEICGTSFQAYYISPGSEADPENFITEVCFPIKKRR